MIASAISPTRVEPVWATGAAVKQRDVAQVTWIARAADAGIWQATIEANVVRNVVKACPVRAASAATLKASASQIGNVAQGLRVLRGNDARATNVLSLAPQQQCCSTSTKAGSVWTSRSR